MLRLLLLLLLLPVLLPLLPPEAVGGGQFDPVANQMAQQMAEPGNVTQAAQSDVAENQMAHQDGGAWQRNTGCAI
jgi:hypothetical protein